LVEALAAFTEVSAIDKEIIITLDTIEGDNEVNAEWGVDNVGAPAVWAMGIDGSGVIVNTIDTGVRGTHEAFANRFVGAYGWYDPSGRTSAPTDGNGHGTHCTGTITGGGEIGVAPGARWTGCRGCATNSCSQADLLACGQWVACPTDTSGNNPDCSRAPHLSSNSWGGGSIPYDAVIASWHAGGITPIFALGNSGSSCSSTNAPGNHRDVIGVGATDINDALASFSSRGPTSDQRIKPEIAAPGVNVRSSFNSGDSAYSSLSGTSMACPHVAGVVALMKAHKSDLTYEQIKSYLYAGARLNYVQTGQNCGGINESRVPNNAFGNGLINAKNTIDLLVRDFPRA
jgi:subtilisin family serine protease